MSEFGWANIKGKLAKGSEGSVQYNDGVGGLAGSDKLIYDESLDTLTLSGSLLVSGSLYANELVIDVTNKNVTNISVTGSTSFGDTTDDIHTFTGTTYLTGATDSALIYLSGSTYLTSSNATHRGLINAAESDDITFIRAHNPSLVVSGTAVFNDGVSIQGGLFGASPISIYAPLSFTREDLSDEEAPAEEMRIEKGKFVGSVVISSSHDNHGLFMQGAGRIVMTSLTGSDGDSSTPTTEPAPEIIMSNKNALPFSNATLDFRNLQDVDPSEHIVFLNRKHSSSRFRAGQIEFRAEVPVLTGSVTGSSTDYRLSNINTIDIAADTDLRRGSTLLSIRTVETNTDKNYKYDSIYNPDLTLESGSAYPIIHPDSPLYNAGDDNYAAKSYLSLMVGSWANPGQDNIYGVNRGIGVFGSIYPFPVNLTAVSGGNFEAKDMTLGHPNTRWGDFYIHDNRYIRWGQGADGYANYYRTNPLTGSLREDSGSVTLGYSTSSYRLEITGAALYMKDGAALGSSTYMNFGAITGSDGYGIRDYSGEVQIKNSAGDWKAVGTGTSQIGDAEDGDYTDGLYTDFVTGTLVGVAVDRFNEVLKILAPTPAPFLQSIYYDQANGVSAKLSFDPSEVIVNYTASSTNAGFSAVARSSTYASSISGSNFRLGVYNAQELTGTINYDTSEVITNGHMTYTSGAFGSGDVGTIKLELNGTVIHSVNLSGLTGTGQPATGSATSLTSGSGFVDVSIASSSIDGNGAEWHIFKYRTAKYKIEADDQNKGWNYLRVLHEAGASNYSSNYIEWINDPDGAGVALAAQGERIEDVSLIGSKYVSGVKYNTDLTANYKAEILNMYRNVFPSSGTPVSFTVSNSATPSSQAVPDLTGGQDETNALQVTASLNCNQNLLLNGTISANLSATHPLKSSLSNVASVSLSGMLIDNDSSSPNSNLSETFEDETFRIISGAYSTQNLVVDSEHIWNSQNHMTSSGATGYADGLLMYNRKLYSPTSTALPGNGNFTSLANVAAGQPNYVGQTGFKTLYRKVQNTSGAAVRDIKISMNKHNSMVRNNTPDGNDIDIHVKIPETTGWMKAWENFSFGNIGDADGALIQNASDNQNIAANGTVLGVHCLTFGTASLADDGYLIVRIRAHSSWTGYLDDITFQLGASDVSQPTETQILDDIDLDVSGVSARLSFGAGNDISGYSVATGSTISLTDFNTNDLYNLSGDRRGVLTSLANINGTINEDIAANGSNYSENSFNRATTGNLILQVNGVNLKTINLESTNNAITDYTANGTGLSVSTASYSTTTDGIPDYTKPFRTGSYIIGAADQRLGWNYAKVIHSITGTAQDTNYVEWIVDTDNNAMASASVSLSNFDHLDRYYQSGIGYFASRPSASYSYTISNAYRNIYSSEADAISFPTTDRCSVSNIRVSGTGIYTTSSAVSSIAMGSLNGSTDCEQKDLYVTGTILFDSLTSISGGLGLFTKYDVDINSTVVHPTKSNITTTSLAKSSFLVYSGSNGSTNETTSEYFNTETYRIVSGNYAAQADTTDASNVWNSLRSINDGATHASYVDGMVTVNGYAISPLKIGNLGDTRNTADGGDFQAPEGNPNYSTLSSSTRTYYRYFKNTTGQAKPTFTVTLYGDANLVAKSGAFYTGALGANKNINVELKVPYDSSYTGEDDTSTGWGDVVKPYSAGVQPSSDGVGIYSGGGGSLNQSVGVSGRAVGIQLQEKQIRNNQYYVLKISAHKDWTGYLSRVVITY